MESPRALDVAEYDATQISPTVTIEDAPAFFAQHGIFYYADADAAKSARENTKTKLIEPQSLAEFEIKDARIGHLLETCEPSFAYSYGGRSKCHYSLLIEDTPDANDRIIVYIFSTPAELEVFPGSHIGPLVGVKAQNGLWQIPWPYMKYTRKIKETTIKLEEGGLLIVHPRLVFGAKNGAFAIAYACRKMIQNTGQPE